MKLNKQVPVMTIGMMAPDFSLPDQSGVERTLSDYRGGWVLIYFYPKDDTPGCTIQACALRDRFPDFECLQVKVLGISIDSVKSHYKFVKKYQLPFTLLADEDKKVAQLYGVWGHKKLFGKELLGTKRTSFLINPEGKIAKIYLDVKPEIHAQVVLADLRQT